MLRSAMIHANAVVCCCGREDQRYDSRIELCTVSVITHKGYNTHQYYEYKQVANFIDIGIAHHRSRAQSFAFAFYLVGCAQIVVTKLNFRTHRKHEE
eukprot:6165782-Pleurochrysis_carterae.AAC.3